MKNTYGEALQLTLFGESHGGAIGAVLDGLAAGIAVDEAFIAAQMDKRRAKGAISTARHEADAVHIVSGVYNGRTTGTPITFIIENKNTKSEDYAKTQQLLRPGHADYTAHVKYHGYEDARGGGHFSGRLTAPLVAAGGVLLPLLAQKGIVLGTHLARCAGISDAPFATEIPALLQQVQALNARDFAVLSEEKGAEMTQAIEAAAAEGDSVGGVLETVILGVPAGLGEPFFGSVESAMASALFSMPAVKSVAFGAGAAFAELRGSEANDAFATDGTHITTATNHNGGINGGITNGMPLVVRTVVKPTPSIYKQQNTVDIAAMQNATLQIAGRHDPCIVHRARVVQDSLCALVVADLAMQCLGTAWQREGATWNMG